MGWWVRSHREIVIESVRYCNLFQLLFCKIPKFLLISSDGTLSLPLAHMFAVLSTQRHGHSTYAQYTHICRALRLCQARVFSISPAGRILTSASLRCQNFDTLGMSWRDSLIFIIGRYRSESLSYEYCVESFFEVVTSLRPKRKCHLLACWSLSEPLGASRSLLAQVDYAPWCQQQADAKDILTASRSARSCLRTLHLSEHHKTVHI